MSLSDDILQQRVNLEVNIDNALSILTLHENILEIAGSKLASIKRALLSTSQNAGTIKQITQTIEMFSNLEGNQQIKSQKEVIKEQVIVLLVGILENYLGEIVKNVGNSQPELFKLKDANERITFTQDMLSGGFKLGDALLEHILNKNYTFQDLQSSLSVFKDYLSIEIDLDDRSRDDLILCAAFRNIFVHNQSTINRHFLKQVRNTIYADEYTSNAVITISDELILSSKSAILEYADQLTAAFTNEENY